VTELPVSDPIEALQAWLGDAERTEPDVPDAISLATVDGAGLPSIRVVLAKDVGPRGITFYTNLGSKKARDLAVNSAAAIGFHWKSLARQVTVEGQVEPVEREVADAYWASRPRGSQIGAYASRQSEPLASSQALAGRVSALEERFAGGPVPRPEFWSGYRLVPRRFVFWIGRESRLHDRCEYVREEDRWVRTLLNP
jgi:pyridoxamine 5'-phosphate oxidase